MLSNMTRYTTTTVSGYNALLSCTFYHKTRLNLASSLLSSFFLFFFSYFSVLSFFFFFTKFQFHVIGWRLAVSNARSLYFIHFSSLTSHCSFLPAGLILKKNRISSTTNRGRRLCKSIESGKKVKKKETREIRFNVNFLGTKTYRLYNILWSRYGDERRIYTRAPTSITCNRIRCKYRNFQINKGNFLYYRSVFKLFSLKQ